MSNRVQERNDGIELDLYRLVNGVWKRFWVVILAAVIGAAAALVGSLLFLTPQYQSSAMFYVNNSNVSVGDVNVSMSSGDLSTSRGLVKSYIVILNTRETMAAVVDYSGVDRNADELAEMIRAESIDDTEIFRVTVTSPDPLEAQKIADAVACILPKRISTIIEGTSAKVADAAVAPTAPSSPSYANNTLIGFALGVLLSVGHLILRELFDDGIRTEADIAQVCDCPVLATVPDMAVRRRGSAYGGRREKGGNVGGNISVSPSEAYKLLRTKLRFSFADENDCHIIGVSSALAGEGKSLSAVNLAHSLSQLDKKVLLMDADMRRPSIFTRLPVQETPGLSELLAEQKDLRSLIQPCGLPGEERAFWVISSGRIPPNPMELLSSVQMAKFLGQLRQHYDYVIMDLPPISEVGDALTVAKSLDGFLLVVRQNGCSRAALKNMLQQLAFVDSRVLGILYNCASDSSCCSAPRNSKRLLMDTREHVK